MTRQEPIKFEDFSASQWVQQYQDKLWRLGRFGALQMR